MSLGRTTNLLRWLALLATCQTVQLAAQSHISPRDEPVFVGFIEDDRRELINKQNDYPPASSRVVITAFARRTSGWEKVDVVSEAVKWTVAFDGRNLGEIETKPSPPSEVITNPNRIESSAYVRAIHTIVTPPSRVPAIGQPTGQFSGLYTGTVRRPLLVVSRPNFHDPDGWRPVSVSAEVAALTRVAFRQTYRHLRQCDHGEPLSQDWTPPDAEIQIAKTYGSNKGSFLVQTRLTHHECVFNAEGKELTNLEGTQWFVVGADLSTRNLGQDMVLVDAGDYDGDGKSEVLFFFGDDDTSREGYILLPSDLHDKVIWSY